MSTRCGRVCAICSLPTKQSESRHSVARHVVSAAGLLRETCRLRAGRRRTSDGRATAERADLNHLCSRCTKYLTQRAMYVHSIRVVASRG